ncbi:MAG TPA: alpha/beta hydrolase [Polyangiaceae bacterium]|jgi:pimeloyl-ACP methyl ester carboxylesterase
MSHVHVGKENSTDIHLSYEDHGKGDAVVLVHGYPLNGASWEKQISALLAAGKRVITYDRRGFGKSSQPATGYDYDTFAADLHALVGHLKLDTFSLAGFSMGGGEVARYMGKYGTKQVKRAAILGGVPPFLLKAPDNAEGVDKSVFDGIEAAIKRDRYAFFTEFFKNFYNADKLLGTRVSEEVLRMGWNTAAFSSPVASLACVATWYTDFRKDLQKIDVPTLVLHGDADRIVPFAASGARTVKAIKGAELVVIKDGPHNFAWTHAEETNAHLVRFFG